MTKLDSILKSIDVTLPAKVRLVKDLVFPIVMCGCESWTIKKAVQFSSVTQSCLTLCDPMNFSTPGLPVHHQLPESTQTHIHWVGDAIQPSHPLSSPSSAFSISQYQDFFQWVRSSHQAAKVLEFQLQQYWSFSFSMSPSNEHPGLISFRMDWLDLLVVQGTLKSLLQHHSSKASIIWSSAFLIIYSHSHTWLLEKP